MEKLICVFNKEDADTLSELGLLLLKEDEPNSLYVFAKNTDIVFDENGEAFMNLPVENYIETNTLTF